MEQNSKKIDKTYTSQEAKQVLQRTEQFISDLNTLCNLSDKNRKEASETAGKFFSDPTLAKKVRQELLTCTERDNPGERSANGLSEMQREKSRINSAEMNANPENRPAETDAHTENTLSETDMQFLPVLRSLDAVIQSESVSADANTIRNKYQNSINVYKTSLRSAIGRIRWFFTSSADKKAAVDSYEQLQELMDGNLGQTVSAMKAYAAKLKDRTSEQIHQSVETDPQKYRKVLQSIRPKVCGADSVPQELRQPLEQYYELRNQVKKLVSEEESERNQVKQAADHLLERGLMDILSDISVDELNRSGNSFRLKTLRDSGYNTMADVYTADTKTLTAINGISAKASEKIKTCARDFAAQAGKDMKIRLNADNRNDESTQLLSALYEYRQQQPIQKDTAEWLKQAGKGPGHDARNLTSIAGIADWFFLNRNQKDSISASLRKLQAELSGEFLSDAQKILNRMEELKASEKIPENTLWDDFTQNTVSYYTLLEELVPGILGNDDSLYGLPEHLAAEIEQENVRSEGLKCELRRYQEWGVKYILHQERVLLGDEMGLGKTIQAIASMVSLYNTGGTHFLVVCPASVLPNWCREIAEKCSIPVSRIHGDGRGQALKDWLKKGGAAVTTFEGCAHIQFPDVFRYCMLIVDEAHYIKNPETKRTAEVKRVGACAERILLMTGTALENKVEEMISLIHFLQPTIAEQVRNLSFMSSAPQFREKIAPVYYRRKREDVLTELPDLIENQEWCSLTGEEENVYEESIFSGNFAQVRRVSWNIADVRTSSKAKRMLELVEEAAAEGRKILIFSFFLDTIEKVQSLLGERCMEPINGSVPVQRRQEILDAFEKAEAGSVLAAQIQSGGTGLNIQSASVVIFCEPQFKPSIENQAISRAYRMGQSRNVLVYRLLCEDTVDEKIMKLLAQKQTLFNAFADRSSAGEETLNLSEDTFGDIIREEEERIRKKNAERVSGTAQSDLQNQA